MTSDSERSETQGVVVSLTACRQCENPSVETTPARGPQRPAGAGDQRELQVSLALGRPDLTLLVLEVRLEIESLYSSATLPLILRSF